MTAAEAIKAITKGKKITQDVLARMAGLGSQGNLSTILSNGNPKLSTLNRILEPLGYEVVAAPKGIPLKEGAIVITCDTDTQE